MAMELLTALNASHRKLGAKMAPFAGYNMPIQYTSVIEEHNAVRNNCGVFDVSHMGFCRVTGPEARELVSLAITRDPNKLHPGKAAYGLLLNNDGLCLDDLIIYCDYFDEFSFILNASNKVRDYQQFCKLAKGMDCEVGPLREDMSILALQGPHSYEVMKSIGYDKEWLPRMSHADCLLENDIAVKVALTGYTGEEGCELIVRNEFAQSLWNSLMEHKVTPCGLAARDTLRCEMGYTLYGHEIDEQTNPLEAGLGWAVDFSKKDFVGKIALEKIKADGVKRKLICLSNSEKRAPRPQMDVYDGQNQLVGKITSGTFGPSLNHAIGMALVNVASQGPYTVDIRNSKVPFYEIKRPFYQKTVRI